MQETVPDGLSESQAEATSSRSSTQNAGGPGHQWEASDSVAGILTSEQPYEPVRSTSTATIAPGVPPGLEDTGHGQSTNGARRRRSGSVGGLRRRSLASNLPGNLDFLDRMEKNDHKAPAAEISKKLGTLSGVFVPTTLNVLSILMFLRFGFVLGQAGVLGMMGESAFTPYLL